MGGRSFIFQPFWAGINKKLMEYNWSWKMMDTKSKHENYQYKLARYIHNFHHGGGNGFNAYGGNNHGNGNFTPRRQNRVRNFSSYVKYYEHTSYDDYREETSNEDSCYSMIEKSIEKEEGNEFKEKERVEEKRD
ncbi:hypothetical protein M9H77_02992 [Catharanthus roseus]|uniref:Uncharacterized protein n=1 Tax=Catharanthus roseus TaxID=4058 RepID=A0ACC0CAE9_CATRO|nr:hypothetical protein M9H77_02992 [Catharanthus roseus]